MKPNLDDLDEMLNEGNKPKDEGPKDHGPNGKDRKPGRKPSFAQYEDQLKPKPPADKEKLPPEPDRLTLTVAAWLKKKIPARDFLMGGVLSTTSRWFFIGATGIGKTLVGMEMGAAIAAGRNFLIWTGQRKAKVMYIDGELPAETFKERMELIAGRYGSDIEFYGYNRDDLGDECFPPLNTEAGQAWLRREIEAIKPDIIFFDSVMCLLLGSMRDEDAWQPMKPFVRWLAAMHVAQVWFIHANESGKSYGDKTREWEMDAVIKLSHPVGEDGEPNKNAIKWEWPKSRLRTPANAEQFEPFVIHIEGDEWRIENAPSGGGRKGGAAQMLRTEFLNAYSRLALDTEQITTGFDGKPVVKVKVDAIRDELKSRGHLEVDERGNVTGPARKTLHGVKLKLIADKVLMENEGWIWHL